jgi:dynein heavy chain
LTAFVERFRAEGPGAVGLDMDRGLVLMDEYADQFESIEKQRIELVNAEKLFDIPLTDYNDFIQIHHEYQDMQVVYKLYKQQKIAREKWSRTLWANLNPQALIDGIEVYMKEFRKFPRKIRQSTVGHALDTVMKQFKASVPLMISLKNEALRDRHWNLLMEKTGQHFDMSPERFTLQNMFAMELHKYQVSGKLCPFFGHVEVLYFFCQERDSWRAKKVGMKNCWLARRRRRGKCFNKIIQR